MSDDKIKDYIDSLLDERINDIANQISSSEDAIFAELEKIKKINSNINYQLPHELAVTGSSKKKDDSLSILHQYTLEIASASNQLNLIGLILKGVINFCSRAAIFLVRDDKLVGWEGKGFGSTKSEIKDKEIKKMFISLSANTAFKYVIKHNKVFEGDLYDHQDNNLIFDRFGSPTPSRIFVLPFFVKGKPQAVVYTDYIEGENALQTEAIEIITKIGELSLDLLPLKQKLKARVKTQKLLGENDDIEDTQPDAGITRETRKEDMIGLTDKQKKAQRFARVTISDIILYNKEKVEAARDNRNIYAALKDTILQAKEAYLIKYSELEFFERELLKTLAEGDEEALKGYKFESI